MTVVEDRPRLTPQADAEGWLVAFDAALQSHDAAVAAELFLADGLWRDMLAFTWNIG
jgi:putative flavoprotein involved in K+ transport